MRLRTVLAASAAALAVAAPGASAYDATALEIAEHGVTTGVSTSYVPPTTNVSVAGFPTVSQAIAKGLPSAYGTITAAWSCSVSAAGDVAFVKITECSVTTNTGAGDNIVADGFVNVAATAGNVNLPGRKITVCVNALVTPRARASFYSGRTCGISV